MENRPTYLKELQERLTHCEAEVARLKSENEQLRCSAMLFGDLAERLNATLLANRRTRPLDRDRA